MHALACKARERLSTWSPIFFLNWPLKAKSIFIEIQMKKSWTLEDGFTFSKDILTEIKTNKQTPDRGYKNI